jgi:pimeloyl-ACP methyl ester carboxylesterase
VAVTTVAAADPKPAVDFKPAAESKRDGVRKPAVVPVGFWQGYAEGGAVDSSFVFEIREAGGKASALVHVLHAEISFPAEKIAFADGKLTLDLGRGDSYVGTLDAAGKSITGTLAIAGIAAELKVEQVEKMPVLNRPQYPKEPLPYASEAVVVENSGAKVKLAGTFTCPKGNGPFPAVVLVSGSGPHDRDGSMFGHKPFLVLADHLARRGIACLRIDDRGVGKSEGNYDTATGAEFASDAYACVKYLQARSEVDARRIGICGHSEGGVSGPIVAVDHPDEVAFVVLLATVGVTGEQLLYEQTLTAMQGLGIPVEPQELRQYAADVVKLLKSDKSTEEVRAEIVKVLLGEATGGSAEHKVDEGGARFMAEQYASPGRRWLISRDPAATLCKLRCPVLALGGSKDTLCHAKQNLAGIETALRAGGNRDFTCGEMPGLNHLFQTCETGLTKEYSRLEETFATAALERISGWILERKK